MMFVTHIYKIVSGLAESCSVLWTSIYRWFFPVDKRPSAGAGDQTDGRRDENAAAAAVEPKDETPRDAIQEIADVVAELDAIVKTYAAIRAAYNASAYADDRGRGGRKSSRATLEKWARDELDGRLDRHRRRLVTFGTKRGEREDLLALEELYVRAECVAPATLGYDLSGEHVFSASDERSRFFFINRRVTSPSTYVVRDSGILMFHVT